MRLLNQGLIWALLVASSGFSGSVWARSDLLLVIDGSQFYPVSGYSSAVSNQDLPAGYRRFTFRVDRGSAVYGQLTIRCRGDGREHRGVGLRAGTVSNPCSMGSPVNFDLYVSSPVLGTGSRDRVRVHGDSGYVPPIYPPSEPVRLAAIDAGDFYGTPGNMAIGGQDLPSGFHTLLVTSDRGRAAVSGRLTIRCRGDGREFRDVVLSPEHGGYGHVMARLTNPCSIHSSLDVDLYLSSPQVGPGVRDTIRILGRR